MTPHAAAPAASSRAVRHLVQRQRLLDVYGGRLTDHQRDACRLHLDEDWSVTELAEHFVCSRSGAYDLLRRALSQLENYEARLGHAAELSRRDVVEAELRRRLAGASGSPAPQRHAPAGGRTPAPQRHAPPGRLTPAPQRPAPPGRSAATSGGSA